MNPYSVSKEAADGNEGEEISFPSCLGAEKCPGGGEQGLQGEKAAGHLEG